MVGQSFDVDFAFGLMIHTHKTTLTGVLTDCCFSCSVVNSSAISYDKEEETVTISFPSPLPLGNGQLCMDFTGELNDKMKGFYRSKYTGTDGKEKYCAVTQFEVWLYTVLSHVPFTLLWFYIVLCIIMLSPINIKRLHLLFKKTISYMYMITLLVNILYLQYIIIHYTYVFMCIL